MFNLELKLNPFAGKEGIEAEVVKEIKCDNSAYVHLYGQDLQRDQYKALELLAAEYGSTPEELFAYDKANNFPRIESADGKVTYLVLNGKHKTGKLVIPKELSNLEKLFCIDNGLSELDVSACKSLDELYCDENDLTELDVSKLNYLQILSCTNNLLSEANKFQLMKLEKKDIELMIDELKTVDFGKNKIYAFQYDALAFLAEQYGQTMSQMYSSPALQDEIYAKDGLITRIFLYGKHKTGRLVIPEEFEELLELECSLNGLTELNVKHCKKLEVLRCGDNQIMQLDVSHCDGLFGLDCRGNHMKQLAIPGSMLDGSGVLCSGNNLPPKVMAVLEELGAMTEDFDDDA